MQAIVPGHSYLLDSFEEGGAPQRIDFIQKTPSPDEPTKLITVMNGTTNEEVLAMLIDRAKHLNALLPSRQTSLAITKMEEALMWFNDRTAERKRRGVEGSHIP